MSLSYKEPSWEILVKEQRLFVWDLDRGAGCLYEYGTDRGRI